MATDNGNGPILTDGTTAFAGGVDSLKVTTVAGELNPQGLRRDQQAWLINGTVRDAGVSPRWGWQPICKIAGPEKFYQRGAFYDPGEPDPYLLLALSGDIVKVDPDAKTVTNLSAAFPGMTIPPTRERGYFCQAEQFMVIQAGDNVTLPLFWDGATLRRSRGLGAVNNNPVATVNTSFIVDTNGAIATAPWATATVNLIAPHDTYGGAVNDVVQWVSANGAVVIGYFQITAIGANSITIAPVAPSSGNNQLGIGVGPWTLYVLPGGVTPATRLAVVPELPAATAMDYYMGRLWYAQGRKYAAGDIVGGSAGTIAYGFRDSVLKVTENPLITGGDGFTVPDEAGNIRALKHSANLNAALGEGQLYAFTRKAVYALTVPVTRGDWINANAQNQPLQTVVQLVNGAVNDDATVPVNGDLYFQSFEPGIRSLVNAVRYFQQPGNIQISANEQRILQFNDRALLRFASGIEFDNRLLNTALPFQTPSGVAHRALVPLDFVPISSFNEAYNPVWEGSYEGLDFMQLFAGDFGGRQRAFAVVNLRKTGELWLYELTNGVRTEDGDKRVTMKIEFPSFTWGNVNKLKKLLGGELWIDRLYGTVEFTLQYRVDGETCPVPWLAWKECSARDTNEFSAPSLTPYPQACGPGYRQTIDFPAPPATCSQMNRPSNIGYQFQPILTVHGYARVRGIFLHATEWKQQLYRNLPCNP